MKITLKNLIQQINDCEISAVLHLDSRAVKPGDIFVAIEGTKADGHDFIPAALKNGAAFVVSQKPVEVEEPAANIIVENCSIVAAKLAQALNKNPAQKLINLAVTGTNGKTTTAMLTQAVINSTGPKCGLIGTINCDTGSEKITSTMTTPDCIQIANLQNKTLAAGSKYMIAEASSHALHQNRLAEIPFKAAAFTNLTGDHLDYHGTAENYLAAKTLLFESLGKNSTAVLNHDDPASKSIAEKTKANLLWYSIDNPADLTAEIISMTPAGTHFKLKFNNQQAEIKTPLLGRHNVSNLLAAAGLTLSAGFDFPTVTKALCMDHTIPGRLEKVPSDKLAVLVDYAHTDDALKNILQTLRPICLNRLIVVFGCGGDRDKTKRPRMAKIAQNYADHIFVTSDNPRTENPDSIITDIMAGFSAPIQDSVKVILDRAKAIQAAIEFADIGDIVLIAGKGHETYQVIGDQIIDFDDKEVAAKCLRSLK